MKKIKIDYIEGCYYVEDDTLIYSCDDTDDVEVSDLTELKIWQYNELFEALAYHYPDYEKDSVNNLRGKFI